MCNLIHQENDKLYYAIDFMFIGKYIDRASAITPPYRRVGIFARNRRPTRPERREKHPRSKITPP